MAKKSLRTTPARFAQIGVAVTLWGALLMALPGSAQVPGAVPVDQQAAEKAKAAKARRNAERFARNARVLTVYDRAGRVVTTVGERGLYQTPVFSPDRTRLAVWKNDLDHETSDLWVLDVATGKGTRLTNNQTWELEGAFWPVWSPDGSQIAYAALRAGRSGVYRKASTGIGNEELLFEHGGGGLFLLDWSMDGRFLSFSSTDLSGGVLYVLPLDGAAPRTPIEIFRSSARAWGSRLSPDGRFFSFASEETGTQEVHVRPFDRATGAKAAPAAGFWQVSSRGGRGPGMWRRDGKELYYLAADRSVMAVKVRTAPTPEFSTPSVLFRPPEAVLVTPEMASVSRDGERVVIAVPHAPVLQQITVFNREGKVLRTVREPGRYRNVALSPDGTRVAVAQFVPETSNQDIWAFDVASGAGGPVTADVAPDDEPIWSPDGSQVAYSSTRGSFTGIYRQHWSGTGRETPLFQYTPGADLVLTDWTADGRFLTFHDGCAGVLHVLHLDDDRPAPKRKAIDWLRDEYGVAQAKLSPDARFVAYLSDELELDTFEVYVRPFDASRVEAGAGDATPLQVSRAGARGMVAWRDDGKELYYLTPEWEVMVVDVTTTPTVHLSAPRRLFTLPGAANGDAQQWTSVSRDGQRFAFAINVPASTTVR